MTFPAIWEPAGTHGQLRFSMDANRAVLETETLVRRCLAGERYAQHQLFHSYRRFIFTLVYRLLGPGPKNDLEDTIQLVYIELFRSLSLFKGDSSLDTWVYRICSRVCLMRMRRKYQKKMLFWSGQQIESEEIPDGSHDPGVDCDNREVRARIYGALRELSPERRTISVLFEIEGRSIQEISSILRKPECTVKSNLFRARKELEDRLKGYVHY